MSSQRTAISIAIAVLSISASTFAANYEVPGNLQAENDLGCAPVKSLRNTYTPVDLYQSNVECVQRGDYEAAVYSNALAGLYARYDSMRVADSSAHQAQSVLLNKYVGSLDEKQKKVFMETISAMVADPKKFSLLCDAFRKIGAPQYKPTYMIQHGMSAVLGKVSEDGLVANFDSATAWERSLDSFLHCPKLQQER